MSNPKGRTIPRTLSLTLLMLVIYALDLFAIKSDLSIMGDTFYSRLLSFVALFIILYSTKEPLNTLGISKKKKKIVGGFVLGTLFSVVPLVIVTGIEFIYYKITNADALTLKFSTPNLTYITKSSIITPGAAIAIYVFTTFIASVFKEFFFRGYVLKTIKKVSDFKTANLIQSVLYMSFTLLMLLRNLLNHVYDNTTSQLGIFIVCFYIIHETLAGLKWGFLTRISGSTYIAIIDHFLYVFLANSIYISKQYVTWSFMLHMLAIQVVSFIFVYIYYKINLKLVAAKKEAQKAEKEAKRKERHIKHQQEIEAQIGVKTQNVNEISPTEYKNLVDEVSAKKRSHKRNSTKKNERHSQANESKLESFNPETAKKADEYLQKQLKKHHHHSSSKKNERHSKANADKLESFENTNVTEKTNEFHNERMAHHHHHSSHSDSRNERHSKANADKLESFENTDVTKKTDEFHNERMEHHHHHSSHSDSRNERHSKANEEKLESFSAENVAEKTTEYSDSLRMERKNSSHPHPHDKIAVDALLSEEEIEQANINKIESFENDSIDEYLRNFSQKKSSHHHHHHHSEKRDALHAEYNNSKIDNVSSEFDVNEYLETYNEKRHSAHHHHSENDNKQKEAQTTVAPKAPEVKEKTSFLSKIKTIFSADDADTNELL
ncbi:MAG: CPBP family intramembrane metalloprotease [Ruminococcus sp.]|nr:CPBP family intramembrane metalloprotease [Candidatus Copronaster equi]